MTESTSEIPPTDPDAESAPTADIDRQPANVDAPRWLIPVLGLALVLVTCGLFSRTLGNGFINFDDPAYVTEVPEIRSGLSLHTLIWSFAGDWKQANETAVSAARNGRQSNWHPLTWLSHALDFQIYGMNAGGHHATSVLLHGLSAALLLAALNGMTGRWFCSLAVASLFALHPLRVQSVSWVAERKDVLSIFFGCLTLYAYSRYVRNGMEGRKSVVAYALTLVAYACSLMSKQTLVTLPFVLLLLDYWPLSRFEEPRAWRKLLLEKVPFFVLAIVAAVIVFLIQQSIGAVRSTEVVPLSLRWQNAIVTYLLYVGQTFVPESLAVQYPYPREISGASLGLAMVVLVAFTAAAMAWFRRRPFGFVGWCWFLGTLIPVIGLVQIGAQPRADRYTYFPQIGLLIVIVWGIDVALAHRPGRRPLAAGLLALALVVLGGRTWVEAGYWRDSTTLFTRALETTRDNRIAHLQLANEQARQNRLAEAETHYLAALQIEPNHANTLLNLAKLYYRQRKDDLAIRYFEKALRSDPSLAAAHVGLGGLYARRREIDAAADEFKAAAALDSTDPDLYFQWGLFHARLGQMNEAATKLERAVRLNPAFTEARDALTEVKKALTPASPPSQPPATRPNVS